MAQYIDKSAVVAEIEKRKEKCDTFYDIALSNNAELAKVAIEEQKRQYNRLLSFLDTLDVKEEPVSEELEEAANDYAHDLVHDDVFETFIAGAKWQKEQMIDMATEWLCHNYDKYIRIIGSSIYPAYVELCKDFQKAMKE